MKHYIKSAEKFTYKMGMATEVSWEKIWVMVLCSEPAEKLNTCQATLSRSAKDSWKV